MLERNRNPASIFLDTGGSRRDRVTASNAQGPRARPARRGAVRRRARRLDRQRRAALDRPRPELLPGEPVLGRQRVHARLRRLPAARRAHGRPARPPPRLHRRPDRLRVRLAARRLRLQRRPADRGARPAGPRRGDPLARGALDPDHDLRRGRRAQPGARRLGRGGRLRRRRRRAARRRADRVPRLGVGPVRQRPDRAVRGRDDLAPAAREPRDRPAPLRRRRRGLDHGRHLAARVRARRRRQRGLGVDADARPDRDLARAGRERSCSSSCGRATR